MKRRVTTSGKAIKGRSRKTTSPKRPTAAAVARNGRSSDTDLRRQLDQSRRELKEGLEQQTATSEVLKVISSSPGDLQPVFQAILENATRICEAEFGTLILIDDGDVRIATTLGVPPAFSEFTKSTVFQPGPISRLRATNETLHIVDYRTDVAYRDRDPLAIAGVELGGIRTLLDVPMLKEGELIGAIGIFRPGSRRGCNAADRSLSERSRHFTELRIADL